MNTPSIREPQYEYQNESSDFNDGVIACAHGHLALGLDNGFVLFDYPELRLLLDEPDIFPPDNNCDGIQLSKTHLIALGSLVSQSISFDWKVLLKWFPIGSTDCSKELYLGKGYWHLVKRLNGNELVVYESLWRDQIMSIDTRTARIRWRIDSPQLRRLDYCGNEYLIGLCRDSKFLLIRLDSGKIIEKFHISNYKVNRYTCATYVDGYYVAGGFTSHRSQYVLACIKPGTLEILWETKNSLVSHFHESLVAGRLEEDEDGVYLPDIHHISNIMYDRLRNGYVCTLGGGGVEMGACRGAAAITFIDSLQKSPWKSLVLNEEIGVSGLISTDDNSYVVSVYGKVYVINLGADGEMPDISVQRNQSLSWIRSIINFASHLVKNRSLE